MQKYSLVKMVYKLFLNWGEKKEREGRKEIRSI